MILKCRLIAFTFPLSLFFLSSYAADAEDKSILEMIKHAEPVSELEFNDELGYMPEGKTPFSGWVKKYYEDSDQVMYLARLHQGVVFETKAWYKNGNPCASKQYWTKDQLWGFSEDLISDIQFAFRAEPWRISSEEYHGEVIIWNDDGQKRHHWNYFRGKEHGLHTSWHDNGQKEIVLNYFYGILYGELKSWHANGQLKSQVEFIHGRPHGIDRSWYKDGRKHREVSFKYGELDGSQTTWSPDGQVRMKAINKKGFRWNADTYLPSGKVDPSIKLENGTGQWALYYENGQKRVHYKLTEGRILSAESWTPTGEESSKIEDGFGVIAVYHEDGSLVGYDLFENGIHSGFERAER